MILKLFLFWRLGLFLVTYFGSLIIPKVANGGLGAIGPGKEFDYFTSWAQWDGGHFYQIAKSGYSQYSDYAFFPLFPSLIKFFATFLDGNYIIAGLLVSNLSFLLFLLIFFKLIKKTFNKKIAFSSLITFLTFPTTFFAVSYYSEAVFLLLMVLAFWFLTTRRYFSTSLAISLASLTRFIGLFLAVCVLYSYLAHLNFKFKKIDIRLIWVLVSFLGFIFFCLYLALTTHDPFKFQSVQTFWTRSISDPISTILSYLWAFAVKNPRPLNDYLDFLLTFIFLALLILGTRRIRSSWWIFSLLVILIPTSTGTLTSMPRYLLASFGTFIIAAQSLEKRPQLKIPIWGISLTLQAVFATLFITGHWVA